MIGIDELDYYALLEIPRSATRAEVERAYRLSQQTYAEGSLALYSVFESSDAAAIRERLDEAYRILSDPECRSEYDESRSTADSPAISTPLSTPGDLASDPEPPARETATATRARVVEEFDSFEDDGRGDFDGLRLRRTRLFRGYEIEEIADVTKVSGTHLRNIEDENFVELPADVYVRGFVTAYARTIGLDPKIVVPSYMARLQASRGGDQRSRFLDRH